MFGWTSATVMALLLAASGCLGSAGQHSATGQASPDLPSASTGTETPTAPTNGSGPRILRADDLVPLTDALRVSVADHRTSEFTVARHPLDADRLLATGMDWDSPDGTVQCAAFASTDGGRSWTATPVLPGHTPTSQHTDPWSAIDARGRGYITCSESNLGLLLAISPDGGFTWGSAKPVNTGGLPAKDALWAGGDGHLLLCFQQGNLQILRSDDQGTTWTQTTFSSIEAGCNGIVQGPGGEFYVIYQGGGQIEADRLNPPPPSLGVVVSEDDGFNWRTTQVSKDLGTAPANMQGAPQAAAPSIAVSNVTGTLFLAAQRYQNAEVAGPVATETQALPLLLRSRDQGRTFENMTVPIVLSPRCTPQEQAAKTPCNLVHPTLTVDAVGRLVMQFTLSNPASTYKEVWVTASSDEGDTWLPPILLAQTDEDQSYAAPGNFLPDPASLPRFVQDVASHPDKAPTALTSRATDLTWPVTHRDGGEYFGITAARDHIVDMWVQHDANGRNQVMARLVEIIYDPQDP